MILEYKTVYKNSTSEIIEKKSRFIANVSPVKNEEEALTFIDCIKKKYYNANHNVFAFIINEIKRYSDDGEPNGTAGIPILSMLEKEEIKNVVVVVTRYFGGTLLGTGGLVKAYQSSAKEGLKKSEVILKKLYNKVSIKIKYDFLGKIQYEILKNENIIIETIYTDLVEFIVLTNNFKNLRDMLQNITNGELSPIFLENTYISNIDDKLIIF